MKVRYLACAVALLLAACGGGERDDEDGAAETTSAATSGATTPSTAATEAGDTAPTATEGTAASESTAAPESTAPADPCDGVTLEATETGISEDTITVTVMADTGSQAIPGMANGSLEAVQGWANVVNENGGLACRQVEVRTFDSKILPDEARNGYIDGCENSFAMVGTFALAVSDMSPLLSCTDQAGQATGLPEVPGVVIIPLHACNPTTFPVVAGGQPCPPVQGVRDIKVATSTGDYVHEVLGDSAHGVYIVANTSPTTVESVMPLYQYMQDVQGIVADAEAGAKGTDPQSHYTPYATALRDSQSNFVFNSATFPSFLQFRNEAAAQGDDSVQLWLCQATCYDPAFGPAGGGLFTDIKVVITSLPFEEAGLNEEVQTFVDNVPTHNTFSTTSWLASRLFERAVNDVVAAEGPNGLTRASLLEALANVADFDANGMIGPTTPSERGPNPCIVVMNTEADGTFTRAFPEEPGTFYCGDIDTINLDPSTAFSG